MNTTATQLVPAAALPKQLLRDMRAAQHRILLQAMEFHSEGPAMQALLQAACEAAARGVVVRLVCDPHSYLNQPSIGTVVRRLRRAGVVVDWCGHGWWGWPVAGRSHVKIYCCDDTVYLGGGVNFSQASFANHDFMLRYRSAEVANKALGVAQNLYSWWGRPDYAIAISAYDTLLADGGRRGQSIILEQACALVRGAKRVWYVSQFAPSGRLASLLRRSQAEVVAFNTARTATSLLDTVGYRALNYRFQAYNQYQGDRKIHAKYIVAEQADRRLVSLTGSHNFNATGVRFGTQETAILTHDQSLGQQLISYARQLV